MSEINKLSLPDSGFRLIEIDNAFWGKDFEGNLIYALKTNDNIDSQKKISSKYLKLFINNEFMQSGENSTVIYNILWIDKSIDFNNEIISIILAYNELQHPKSLIDFFMKLSKIFKERPKLNKSGLIGFYGELILIFCLQSKIDLISLYQSRDKLLFDFSISEKFKLEVKTTTKNKREHHFKFDQINHPMLTVIIASIILDYDDKGTTIVQLINEIIDKFAPNVDFLINIHSKLAEFDKSDSDQIRFNKVIACQSINFYNSLDLPQLLNEEERNKIYNLEFDADLSNLIPITFQDIFSLFGSLS